MCKEGLGNKDFSAVYEGAYCGRAAETAADEPTRGAARGSAVGAGGGQFASGFSLPAPKSLDAIIKLEAVAGKTAEEIAAIWQGYHLGRGHVSAVMAARLFATLADRATRCPLFVLPVRKERGFITMLLQAQMPHLLFTGLEDYKALGPQATPYMTVSHYKDLADTKGLVLVRGDVVLPSKLNDDEAKALLKDAHAFFLEDNKYRHVTTFNKASADFKFEEVLREAGVPFSP
eukprot:SM000081S22610  [mRNA]  locus=s81:4969:11336:+ [translate_table: standard]